MSVRPCHEKKRNVPRLVAAAQLFKELAAVEARHFVIAKNYVGRLIDHLQQRIGAIGSDLNFANVIEPLLNQLADEWIVIHQQQNDVLCRMRCRGAHRPPRLDR